MDDLDRAWLAGLLEGEGSFMKGPPSSPNQPIVSCHMTDKDVIDKVALLMGNKSVKFVKKKAEHHKDSWSVRVVGRPAVRLMEELLPLMGERRAGQIQEALDSFEWRQGIVPHEAYDEIVGRMNSGERVKDIAKQYGVTHWTLYRIRERHG